MNESTLTRETNDPACTPHPTGQRGPLSLTVYGPQSELSGFEALAPEWNDLVQRSVSNTLFLTWEWQSTWWKHLGDGDLWILALREPHDGRLVAIAPFYRILFSEGELAGQRQLNLVGCIEVSDYLDLIIEQGWEEAAGAAIVEWLMGPDAPEWDRVDLCNLPEDSLTWQLMPGLLEGVGLSVNTFQEDVAPQFALPVRYEDYLQNQVEKKQRHEIRRKQRRAEREADAGFMVVGPGQSLEVEVDDFIALQKASRTDKSLFMTPEMQRFFHAAARVLFDAGWLRLCFFTLDGEKAAALYAFEYNRRFMLYNSGYDPESHAQLSPGWVILSYAIQYAIASGCRVFDFMQGDEEYKYRFGSVDYRVMRVQAIRQERRLEAA